MADFVAVIRRAVDSLPSNTPEMRAKVYDKARAAVRRQLENMKPAPPEEMLRRQMDKLEEAILSVDAEHVEALPAEALPGEEDVLAEAAAPIAEQPEPPPEEAEAEPEISDEPASDEESYPADEEPGTWSQEPEAAAAEPVEYEQPDETHIDEPETAPSQAADNPMDDDFPYPVRGPVAPIATGEAEASEWTRLDVPPATGEAAEQAASDGWNWPSQEPSAVEPSNNAETGWNDVPELPVAPTEAEDFSAPVLGDEGVSEAHFAQESHATADAVRMPSVSSFPDLAAGAAAISSQLDARHGAADELSEADALQSAGHSGDHAPESDPWNDLEDLIGYNKDAAPAGNAAGGEPVVEAAGAAAPRAYRVAPKKRNYTGVILALIGLLIVAGGGYALWLNRDSLTEIVGGVEDTLPVATSADGDTPVEATAPDGPVETPATPTGDEDAAATPPVGADDGVTAEAKFTQRLLPDGTEVDEGPGPEGVTGAGQSVAELNAPPASGEAAASSDTGEATINPTDAAALPGEKMFLYEERIGQTAPTAIEGTVSWSLQREAGTENAREPVVQGRINVPGRGLTALITFKRNTDASLPASHLVEIVFSVPPGFEGGAVDSVQRIAMKQTEQDRGDALIAVPAKITDDFHMIALNDFPDARTTNLELMRTRGWMDIPLAYRNGRRALLTLQKGEAGNAAFNEAIKEWSAMASSTASGQ